MKHTFLKPICKVLKKQLFILERMGKDIEFDTIRCRLANCLDILSDLPLDTANQIGQLTQKLICTIREHTEVYVSSRKVHLFALPCIYVYYHTP